MANSEYCEITIDIFLKMTGPVPFDVFIQIRKDKFTRIFKRNDLVDSNRIENYIKKGAAHLYILRKERRFYIDATERFIKKALSQSTITSEEAGRAIEELSEQTL